MRNINWLSLHLSFQPIFQSISLLPNLPNCLQWTALHLLDSLESPDPLHRLLTILTIFSFPFVSLIWMIMQITLIFFHWCGWALLGIPVIYLKLPVDATISALASLQWIPQTWTEYDRNMTFLKLENHLDLGIQVKIMKLTEVVWEALPQLLLATAYYYNNKNYIWFTETNHPLVIPTTLVSMFFSLLSVIFGFITATYPGNDDDAFQQVAKRTRLNYFVNTYWMILVFVVVFYFALFMLWIASRFGCTHDLCKLFYWN